MGSEDFYPEEAPVQPVSVDGFWIDESAVTAAEFRGFVRETRYVTVAERPLDPEQYPDADPELLVPGSLVFRMTGGPVPLDDVRNWWEYVPGAYWKRPGGPGTTINGRDRHPVVHVAHEDAEAYAAWAGKELPSEAEWERAARGGIEGAPFAWGDEHFPDGRPAANTWQGEFPWQNLKLDGYEGTAPVGSFPPNDYGLYDMCGNTWEWTSDWYAPRCAEPVSSPCCAPRNPTGDLGGRELCRRTPWRAHSAACDQGRVAPLCTQLLPALSARRPAGGGDRHLDRAHRLPLHRPAAEPCGPGHECRPRRRLELRRREPVVDAREVEITPSG